MPYGLSNQSKQNLSSEERARARDAMGMIPFGAAMRDADAALTQQQNRANSRVSPEVQSQRSAAARIARLQTMHAQMMEQGNVADAEAIAQIMQDLQGQAAPGSVMGRQVGARIAQQRNAFAGMGGHGTQRRQ